MYKRRSASHRSCPKPWFRGLAGRGHIVAFGIVALGTLFYSAPRIHADDSRHHPVSFGRATKSSQPNPQSEEDADFARRRLWLLAGAGTITGDTGISRFDVISVPNSNPRQDTALMSSVRVSSGSSLTIFTLIDGYDGWENFSAVSFRLASTLLDGLLSVFAKYEPLAEHAEVGTVPHVEPVLEPFDDAINRKIKDVFVDVDDSIVHRPFDFTSTPPSKSWVTAALGPALSGSSAIMALYDSEPRKLRIALTGNSRAVLGRPARRKNGQKSYEVHVLTSDQTCDNPAEVARLRSQHPDEPLCSDGQVLGCGLTRAFGLAAYKWSREVQERLHREFFGEPPLHDAKSPPYVIAEPEITSIEVKPGDFLVMASHGLWDSLTNEEAIGLVGLWLDSGMAVDAGVTPHSADIISPSDLPVSLGEDNTVMYSRWRAEKKFMCIDNNAAAHLARNALGGADVSLTAALLAMEPPRAQKFRGGINLTSGLCPPAEAELLKEHVNAGAYGANLVWHHTFQIGRGTPRLLRDVIPVARQSWDGEGVG
ncbi:putative serine/threonine phosphatases, family 2C, catalytic domain [Lyophyllum shimeji]|uniref:Serine/threonine phosphatases, family 2C, catalytic domain n=1 Tax=Lyophyllum shimeji TaxID=47721 RepID=A0A9P3ULI0_LYOSH|nr:putative serine/threonine phosphatases, family 2C, catalytic domain [Lyophyllum shimeji]